MPSAESVGPRGGSSRNIEGVADDGIAGDLRLLAIAEELEAKPVLRHEISGVTSPDHVVEEGPYSVAHEQIALNDRLGCSLQHQPKGSAAGIPREDVVADGEAVRVHDHGAGGAMVKDISLEQVLVAEHVVQPEAHLAHLIAGNSCAVAVLEVDAVPHPCDAAVGDRHLARGMQVDPVACLALGQPSWPLDVYPPDRDAPRLPQVYAEQDVADLEILQRDRVGPYHHPGIVPVGIAPAVLDPEPSQTWSPAR